MNKKHFVGILVALLFTSLNSFAQTPGMIIEPATGSGSVVLDPNADGYVSTYSTGFVTDDELESEIPFTPFIFPGLEPNSDLNNAPNCGFTDFVDKGNKDPGQKFLTSAGKWIFRLRMGSVSPNAKSYSILIDTDQKFGNTGPNADPDYTITNPGFEIEIVLATKFGVFVYDVNTPSCSPVISYTGTTNYQKSIALTNECLDPDYFLDFFVNFSDLTSQFGVTTSTLMRYAIVDNTAANKSTMCNPSSASDIGGVGNCPNLGTCFQTIINAQGFCSPNQSTCSARSDCPIPASISASATSVNGSSSEANGTVIKLYKNTVFTASTTVSGGTWTITGLSPALTAGDAIDITATAIGEYESLSNCNSQTITVCTGTIAAPVVSNATGKNFCGTGTTGYNINVFYPDGSLFAANPLTSAYMPVPSGGSWVWKCTGNTGGCNAGSGVDCIPKGGYILYQVDGNGCKSFPAFACVNTGSGYSPSTTQSPTIIASSVVSGTNSIQVAVALNGTPSPQSGYVHLFVNGGFYAISNQITSSGTVNVSCPALSGCSTLSAVFVQSGSGSGDHDCYSSYSNTVAVSSGTTTAPGITTNFCTTSSIGSVNGTSGEPNGTIVQVYVNGSATGTPAVVNSGTWVVNGLSISPGSTVTALATSNCKNVSAASLAYVVQSQSSSSSLSVTTSPIVEQSGSISGTGTNGSAVQLYIDGSPIGGTVSVSSGTWTVSGLASYEVYTGGIISAAAIIGSGCPSQTVSGGVVICIPPTNTLALNPSSVIICSSSGSTSLSLNNSQSGVVYQMFLANGVTTTGASVLGNGNTITLSTGTLNASTTLRVKAIKMPSGSCSAFQTNTVPVYFASPISSLNVSCSHSVICSGNVATITVTNSQTGFNYQIRNNSGNAIIGSTVAGTGGNISFTTGAVTSTNSSFNIFASGSGTNTCTGTLSTLINISVSASPTISLNNVTGNSEISCNTPSISLNASGGGTYLWSGGLGSGSGATVTSPGNYSVTVTNTAGCSSVSTIAITANTIAPTLTLTNNSGTTQITCTTPSINLSASGANTYSWTGGLGTSATATPTTAGNYSVTGTGTNGCSTTTGIVVTSNTVAPSLTLTNNSGTTQKTCSTPSISLTASGAVSYTWNSALGSAASVTVGSAGNYSVTGTGTNGCSTTTGIAITSNTSAPTLTITNNTGTTQISCNTPSISLSALGAVTYSWSGGLGSSANVTISAVGNYSVIGTGTNGCSTTSVIGITSNNSAPSAGINNNSATNVLNCSTTSISLTATGGGTYVWSGGLGTGTNAIVTSAGNYTVTVTNTAGCSATATIAITANTVVPTLTLTNSTGVTQITCNTPSISLSASGANSYSWSGGLGTLANAIATVAGNYSVTGTGTNGCSSTTAIAITINTIAPTAGINNNTGSTILTCTTTSVSLTATGGGSYAWSGGLGTGTNVLVTVPGNYSVTVTATNGCASIGTLAVTQSTAAPTLTISATSTAICISQSATLSATGANNYTWQPSATVSSSIVVSPTATTVYTLTGFTGICGNTKTISIIINNCPTAISDATNTMQNSPVIGNVSNNDINASGGTFSVLNQPSGGTLVISPTTGQYTFSPSPSFTGVTTATYQLCNGSPSICTSASVTFTVYPTLTAVPDIITTTPSVSVTWSLTINDLGFINSLGATYSVSVTQVSGTTGTLTINPTTGQYTFVPNPSFTGSTQTTYTICNTALNPQVCSSSSITIFVGINPLAVNDATNTIQNTPVISSAGLNDNGAQSALNPSFTCGSSSNGTIVMNPSNGQFTFTPANGFTGTASITYTLCNIMPVNCSTAAITISVYPMIVANIDVVNTTPSVSTTGSLLLNDLGIVSGGTLTANYSVTITQPSPTVGVFTINPATGQYTFVPAPAFVGTAQTTYTVCNTSLIPAVCASTTININVFANPVPVNDTVKTLINTPVIANVSLNDIGSTGGTYSITGQPSGGSIVINNSTGQYTFTPSSTFTGVTTATYQLCNGAPVTCSTAIITITVYPALQANDDNIVTTPNTTVGGTLTLNDLGILPGGTYSINTNPLPPSTGTLVVNASTGQYTFIPNPLFTGTAVTVYTICNIGINPQQCSTASISIVVGNVPVAVDDATVTISGIAVSGNAGTNDNNLQGAQFTFGVASSGTLSGNPSTGQYTYTPAAGYTGTASVTYTLCNISSPPCATATIMFTVYPLLVAVNDQTITNINTPVTGSFTVNDIGLVSNGNYSITYTPPTPSQGSMVVNPSTGQYTFTPNPGYTGTMVTTYTICQYTGTLELQCSTATITIEINGKASIGLAKSLSKITYNNDNTVNLTYKLVVKNTGSIPLSDVVISDNLNTTFPSPVTFSVVNMPAIIDVAQSQLILSNAFTGMGSNSVITVASSSLAVGKTDTILFTVRIKPNGYSGGFNNSALVSANGSGKQIDDLSINGADPDPDNDSDPTNNSGPTSFTVNAVKIGLAKSVSIANLGNNCSEASFKFVIKNYANSTAYNVALIDNLTSTFPSPANFRILSIPVSISGMLLPEAGYTGSGTNLNLLLNTSSLSAGAVDTVVLRVEFCSTSGLSFSNTAVVSANSLPGGGFKGQDNSTNGLNPDPNGNGDPEDDGENSPTVFTQTQELFVPEGFSPNNDNVNDLFKIRGIENYPNNELSIINRWGNVVFRKKSYDNSWNGTANQGLSYGDNILPEGTYFYILDLGDKSKPLKGFIYLNHTQQ